MVEADVACIKVTVHTLIKALGIDLDIGFSNRSLTELHPRASAEDALSINAHPRFEVVEYLGFLLVVSAISTQRNA